MKKPTKITLILWITFSFFSTFSFVSAANGTLFGLIQQHITLWLSNTTQNAPTQIIDNATISNPLEAQKLVDQFNQQSLIDKLDIAGTSQNRLLVLQNYLSTANTLLQTLQKFLNSENSTISAYNTKIQECNLPLTTLNTSYQSAIKLYQYQQTTSLSREIAQNRACIAENTVYYKEHSLYRDMMQSSITNLQKKVTYISSQQQTIAQHYEILKPQLLKELYNVSNTLQSNF